MTDVKSRVVELTEEHMSWGFDADSPRLCPPRRKAYVYGEKVDPFPCYTHDSVLVDAIASRCEQVFPTQYPPFYYICNYECEGRTNGSAHHDSVYDHESGKTTEWETHIYLWGKRIPPHPAMTKYLVSHEYGHLVQHQIERNRGLDCHNDSLRHEYMKLRPGSNWGYGAKRWHSNVGELIANDFRICVMEMESGFWPHNGFPHPLEVVEIQDFWEKAVAENLQALNKEGK